MGKDLAEICSALLPNGETFIVTRAEAVRSLQPEEVAATLRGLSTEVQVEVVSDPHQAVRSAHSACGPDDLLCVTGSIYLAGIARGLLCSDAP